MQPVKLPVGSLIPQPRTFPDLEKIEKAEEAKKQRKHDWIIAIFSTISGGIMGLISSIIFWLITK